MHPRNTLQGSKLYEPNYQVHSNNTRSNYNILSIDSMAVQLHTLMS